MEVVEALPHRLGAGVAVAEVPAVVAEAEVHLPPQREVLPVVHRRLLPVARRLLLPLVRVAVTGRSPWGNYRGMELEEGLGRSLPCPRWQPGWRVHPSHRPPLLLALIILR